MGLLYSNYECNPVTNNSLKMNAISGTLTKTFKDSYFARFEQNSASEHFYFREDGPSRILRVEDYCFGKCECYDYKFYELKEIVVLQVMLCSDKNYLVEAIDKEDYDKIFDIKEEENTNEK